MHIAEPKISAPIEASSPDPWGPELAAAARRRHIWKAAGALAILAAGIATYSHYTAPPSVAVTTVKTAPAERILAVSGRVRPPESVTVVPKVSGEVVELFKDEGDTVAAGEILGKIDDARARSALTQADAAAAGQRKVLDQAERDRARAQALLDTGTGTTAGLEAATLSVKRAVDDLRRLEAVRDDAALRLEEYKLLAPIGGRILTRPIDRGQVVDGRAAVFELAPIAGREVETEVDEGYGMSLALGQPARLAFAGVEGTVDGRISYLSPRIDTATGGRLVRIAFEPPANLAGELPIGLSVDVNIIVERRETALLVPRSALRDPTTKPYVVMVENGVLARQPVSFKDWPAAEVMIDSGVKAGDVLVVSPAPPADGTEVRISTETKRPANALRR
jgi:RND family efflux transporter MFP subunit